MKKRVADKFWIPFWTQKWLWGSLRIECTHEERAIWMDLLAVAAQDGGYIRANETTPYPIEQLAGMLIIKPEKVLEDAIEKFINLKDPETGLGKIERLENGTLRIVKWEKYQFTDRYKRKIEGESSEKEEHSSEKEEPILNKSKDTINDNKIKNNKIELPEWIPKEEFEEYKKMRIKIKKPMTKKAMQLAISKLEKLKESGNDPKEVLEQSILNSWQGLFEIKKSGSPEKTKKQLWKEEQERIFLARGENDKQK